ncbi:CAP domain-containing protein [Roseitranquillus sediminis]|uniref:CAP domain-containing protein n=1 Tax=Roseitranquillus sediminis TaxID=2809051 RepID=UPI001D0CC26C|nr:CAP domain-containing protein [Roseitranquillus sediminis]MBM9593821.1 CAP domain-containing protein [Roseitranquillus sediminis]
MKRSSLLLVPAFLALVACAPTAEPRLDAQGRPLPQVYRIRASQTDEIQFRLLDAVNSLRQASGAQALRLDSQLNAAARTHSRDMAVQNRPWHFGSDGSSPLERVRRVGYSGTFLGETISETFETEIETLGAWMNDPATRRIILDNRATDLGFSWYQENNGKIWWTLVTGRSGGLTG